MISICIPYIRPQNMPALIERIKETCVGIDYEIVAEEDKDRIGCPKMLKRLVERSRGDQVCFIADDTIPKDGWLQAALKSMSELPDGWGVVGLNSQQSRHAAHFFADKRMLHSLDGEFFSTEYKHCWCDNELTDIAVEHGRYVFCDDAVLEHKHPVFGTAPVDDDHNRVYSEEFKKHDFQTYCQRKRKRNGFKLGIGFPVIDSKVYLGFFTSFVCINKPDFTLLLPNFPTGEFARDIAIVRNNLVEQALAEGCTHLLMMDTDQIYRTPDMIDRMFSHGERVVSAPVHRRYEPFDPIMLQGDIGKFETTPDEVAYSGDIVKVDATGTGCILYDVTVFEDIDQPWFELKINKETGKPVGEDVAFCMKLKEIGESVWVDTSIEVGHLTVFEVNKSTHQLFKKAYGLN